ncbi:hypothetical protein ON010_g3172 [Phytophthora cinnamomi]|nr:hypothetical protein ON010_g3172 [Phytophthora cinnamomi]
MVSKPEQWVSDIAEAGGDQYTFHLESSQDPLALIKQIRDAGMKVGLAIKPGTSAEAAFPYVELVDMVLVMTVEPGFGGQSFMADMMPKVETIRAKYPTLDIEVDGGLGPSTIDAAAKAGANMIVAGSSVFKAADPRAVIVQMRNSVENSTTYFEPVDGSKEEEYPTMQKVYKEGAGRQGETMLPQQLRLGSARDYIPYLHILIGVVVTGSGGVLGSEPLVLVLGPDAEHHELELSHLAVEVHQQLGLLGGQRLPGLADGVFAAEHDDALLEVHGQSQPAQRLEHAANELRQRALGDRDGLRGHEARARVVADRELGEVVDDLVVRLAGEQQAGVAADVLGEAEEVLGVLLLLGAAERELHDLVLAQEEAAVLEVHAHLLKVVGAHVLEAEDVGGLVCVHGIADGVHHVLLELVALLVGLRERLGALSLGLGHGSGLAATGLACVGLCLRVRLCPLPVQPPPTKKSTFCITIFSSNGASVSSYQASHSSKIEFTVC